MLDSKSPRQIHSSVNEETLDFDRLIFPSLEVNFVPLRFLKILEKLGTRLEYTENAVELPI